MGFVWIFLIFVATKSVTGTFGRGTRGRGDTGDTGTRGRGDDVGRGDAGTRGRGTQGRGDALGLEDVLEDFVLNFKVVFCVYR